MSKFGKFRRKRIISPYIRMKNTEIKSLYTKENDKVIVDTLLYVIEEKLYYTVAYMLTLVFPTNHKFKEKEKMVKDYMKLLIKEYMLGFYVKEQVGEANEHYHIIVCISNYVSYFKLNAERNWYNLLEEKIYGSRLNGEMLKAYGYKHLYKFQYIKNKKKAISYILKEKQKQDEMFKLTLVAYKDTKKVFLDEIMNYIIFEVKDE